MPEEQRQTIVVNDKACISCGICVSLCPHQALSMQERLPVVTGKCRVCGLCASSCITKAISMRAKKFSDEGIIEELTDVAGKFVVFACRRKIEKEKEYSARVVSLLCSARFDMALAAEAFARGAAGVAVVGCEDCRNAYGSGEAANKVWALNEILKTIGERAEVVFATSIDEAIGKLKEEKVESAELLKAVTLDRNVRAVVAKMRQITEEGNAYGEKMDRKRYEEVARRVIETAVKVAKVRIASGGGAKISEVAEKAGMDPSEVLDAVLEMKRRDEVAVEVDEELVVIPR